MAEIGSIIDGKYEILTELGHGGMSVVYLAMDRRLKKQWAVKEAKKKPPGQSNIVGLTPVSEAEMLTKLNHPNIVRMRPFTRMHWAGSRRKRGFSKAAALRFAAVRWQRQADKNPASWRI